MTIALAIPIAIGTAIYITEFAPKGRILTVIELNLSNLAGVPSIIYGILGLAVFTRGVEFSGIQLIPALGPSILAGSLTLAIMIQMTSGTSGGRNTARRVCVYAVHPSFGAGYSAAIRADTVANSALAVS